MSTLNNDPHISEPVDRSRRAFLSGRPQVPKNLAPENTLPQIAQIGNKCMALDRVACQICGDICEPQAIKFFWAHKKVPMPQINAEDCTGCGACLEICPASAILLTATTNTVKENAHAK